jgi:hypothetical protein
MLLVARRQEHTPGRRMGPVIAGVRKELQVWGYSFGESLRKQGFFSGLDAVRIGLWLGVNKSCWERRKTSWRLKLQFFFFFLNQQSLRWAKVDRCLIIFVVGQCPWFCGCSDMVMEWFDLVFVLIYHGHIVALSNVEVLWDCLCSVEYQDLP